MDYLTNYYKNLCEELQQRLAVLEKELHEAQVRGPAQIRQLGSTEADKAKAAVLAQGGSEEDAMKAMSGVYRQYLSRAGKRESQIQKNIEILPDLAQTGDIETTSMVGNVLSDVSKALNPVPGSEKMREAEASQRATQDKYSDKGQGPRTGKPSNIKDLRRFIEVAKGQYTAPYQQPEEGGIGHITPSQY